MTACSSLEIGGGDVASLYAVAKNMWSGSNRNVTLAQAASVPYASMGVRLGDHPQTMVILAGDIGGQHLWTSAAKIALTTKDGRIVRTSGFARNLSGYGAARDTSEKAGGWTVRWLADFADLGLYSVPIACQDRNDGDDTITILGKAIHTQRVDESCTSQSERLDWSFQNTYWIDPQNGFTWRSIQNVHPQLDVIETEILRPPL